MIFDQKAISVNKLAVVAFCAMFAIFLIGAMNSNFPVSTEPIKFEDYLSLIVIFGWPLIDLFDILLRKPLEKS